MNNDKLKLLEELLKEIFHELENFNFDGIDNFRDFVDYCVKLDGRYIYKNEAWRIIKKGVAHNIAKEIDKKTIQDIIDNGGKND